MSKSLAALFVLLTIALTVYGQLIVKWQILDAGDYPGAWVDRLEYMGRLLLNPWVISVFVGAFIAAMCWITALTRFELSVVYPFMSLSFVLVLVLSAVFFNEAITPAKTIGIGLIVAGLAIGSQS
jgi:multidrug transporter EmrE-like cation transporter